MTNKAMKYRLMTIAAVLLVAMAFAGAASADTRVIDNLEDYIANFSGTTLNSEETYHIKGTWEIPSLNNLSHLTIGNNVSLDFTDFSGTFAGIPTIASVTSGALFGSVHINSSQTLEIVGINLNSVTVETSTFSSGIIGYVDGSGTLNFTKCYLENCSINGTNAAGLVCWVEGPKVNVDNCTAVHCDMVATKYEAGGLICYVHSGSADFVNCRVSNCTVKGVQFTGGLIGNGPVSNIVRSTVENSVVSTYGSANLGGMIGCTGYTGKMEWCNVTNCIIAGTGGGNGGLVGCGEPAKECKFCTVMNCTIIGTDNVAALLGNTWTTGAPENWTDNKVINCAVGSSISSVMLVCGNEPAYEQPANCTIIGENFINNDTIKDTINLWCPLDGAFWYSVHNTTAENMTSAPQKLQRVVTDVGYYGAVDGYGAYLPVYTVTYDGNSAPSGEVPQSQRDLAGSIITVADKSTLAKMGYNFTGWNFGTTTGELKQPGDKFALTANTTLYANWTVNTTTVTVSDNDAEFHNDNITAIHSTSGNVVKVLLDIVQNVKDEDVVFTADNTTLSIPDLNGYTKEEIAVFEIRANVSDFSGVSGIGINVTFKDAATATANKDKIKFFHYNTTNNAWDMTPLAVLDPLDPYTDWGNGVVAYSVLTTSFSPFGVGIYTAIPQQYTPSSSSKHSGSTVILQEGQTAPTAYATAAPTVTPTAKPTEQPTTPTVIATAKPTTQATQQSPAPFVGILAGLGATALVLGRLRK